MELGGKDPAYVLSDTNLDFAVENIIDGAFFNSGQCCCSIERCYVESSIYDAFVEKAVALTKVINTTPCLFGTNIVIRHMFLVTLTVKKPLWVLWLI